MDNKQVKAVLFDLDGTLINTLNSLQYSMNQVMRAFGCDEISLEQTRHYVGDGYHKFVERALAATADKLYAQAEKWEEKDAEKAFEYDQKADEVMECYDDACTFYMEVFNKNFMYEADAYDGMRETLRGLREKGVKLAVVTNKPTEAAVQALDTVFGAGVFDYISADDGTHPLKPDAGVVADACAHLCVKPEECVFVGDSNTDIRTAKNANIRSIGCAYGFRGAEELKKCGADSIAEKPLDILAFLS